MRETKTKWYIVKIWKLPVWTWIVIIVLVIGGIGNIVDPPSESNSYKYTTSSINKSSSLSKKADLNKIEEPEKKEISKIDKVDKVNKTTSEIKTPSKKQEEIKNNKSEETDVRVETKIEDNIITTNITKNVNNFDTYTNTKVDSEFVGNSDSKKFHKQKCRYVKKMNPSNTVKFKSREEAIKAGYIPCKVCDP